jgi:hypothetical protein
MKVCIVTVETESCDRYVWAYAEQPTRAQVIQRLYESERAESLEWYDETTCVYFDTDEVK